MSFPYGLDPHARDPGRWATSLLHNAELVLGCLDAVHARSVTEVGAFMGELTRLLVRWAEPSGARITVVDTAPHADLEALADETEITLIRGTSHDALAEIPLDDAIILDGDHNYYTLSEELRIISERSSAAATRLPLLMFHDVGWPHDRRDDYYVPERIPPEHRHPLASEGLFPGEPGTVHGGIPCDHPAAREGGPANGVLTAIEDFVSTRPELRLAIVPAFYGLGVVWNPAAPHDGALSALLSPWDRDPVLRRLEGNRVLHLAGAHVQMILAQEAEQRLAEQTLRLQRHTELLTRMRGSRVLRAAELLLALRGGEAVFARRHLDEAMR